MIRPAGPADVPTILSLIQELASYERASDQVKATEQQLHDALFGPDRGRCVPARRPPTTGRPAAGGSWASRSGFAPSRPGTEPPRSTSKTSSSLPDARGGGHGRALLTELAAIAVERGYGRVEWSVLNWNEPAHGFYRRLGAAPQDEWTVWRLTGHALDGAG